MSIRQIGAEFTRVTSAGSTDICEILQIDSTTGQYAPKTITVSNLLAGGSASPDLNAGSSGVAGTIDIFPATASKGKTQITATDNAGNTTTTITNAAQAGARTYTIPDAGANATFMMQNKGTGTEAANAVTVNTLSGVITTSSLNTAAGSSYAITLTNSTIAATSQIYITSAGGTNTRQNYKIVATSGSGTATITIYNTEPTDALNGTIIFNFFIIP